MKTATYKRLLDICSKRAGYVCLIDPDKQSPDESAKMAKACEDNGADVILVGGSMMLNNSYESGLKAIQEMVSIPVLIFPGIFDFVSPYADALLLLSVLSSRNPQMLIGEQVRAAPKIKHFGIETIGTGYLLVESGRLTTVQYMSNSLPIPREKNDVAISHALAGQYLGMRIIYMDAGSGADNPITISMIESVRSSIQVPLFIGGGIRTPKKATEAAKAGADFIVIGTALEKNGSSNLIREFANAIHSVKR